VGKDQIASLTSDNSQYDNDDGNGGNDGNNDVNKDDDLNRVFGIFCEVRNGNGNGM
jgi:hypothetical protein